MNDLNLQAGVRPPAVPGFPADLPPLRLDGRPGAAARAYVQEVRALLFRRHREGASGTEIVRAFTEAVDRLVVALYEDAARRYLEKEPRLGQRLAVIAQGGYGRGELNPCSDIDLLVLFPRRLDPFTETVTEKILYALFDTGMEVGHALRNFRDCVRLASQDPKVKSALLDLRFLCGDRELYDEFTRMLERSVWKRAPREFVRRKIEEFHERQHRYGDSVYLLEPHVKEGQGGLRDLHTALWIARVVYHAEDLRDLVRKGILTERELREVLEARDFLWRVRNELHFSSGRHLDQLTFEYQEKMAPLFGFEDTPELKGVERFLRTYYLHAATVHRFALDMIELSQEHPRPYRTLGQLVGRDVRPGVRIRTGQLWIRDAELFRRDPVELLRVFRDCQRHGVRLSNAAKRLVRAHLDRIDDRLRRSPEAAQVFLDILRWKVDVYETLAEMHRLGVLGAYLPEFGELLCMVQHDLYHIYTVDQHSLMGVRELERLRDGEYRDEVPLLTQVVREVDAIEIVFLGILLHDVGKGKGGGHSERGARLARAVAERLGLDPDRSRQLEFLVRYHLLMSHLAQRRDIHDPRLVAGFARRVGDPETLRMLYLLTFADMRAVGPQVWNSWKDLLLSELYRSALEVFETGRFVEESQEARVGRIRERVGERLRTGGADPRAVEEFLGDMPDRYFLATPEERIPRHFGLWRRGLGEALVTDVRHFPRWEFSEFTVVTADRPGVFATITGVLAAHGRNILGAQITTSRSGRVLDVFRVSHDAGDEALDERWERIRRDLVRVLRGEVEVEELLRARETPPPWAQKVVPRVGTDVQVDNRVSDQYTVLDVFTQDRRGLLYLITNTLYHLGLSVHLAKVTTNVDQVLDVFYVTDHRGGKIEDRARLEEIREVLLARLEAAGGGGA
ncbi:MAG: bifunctional uridylyltransferase/uridylyl-removing enzyme [Candidatus Binatia bacterium]|nr:MAG: bifunctional uridylyltransferase/uridylyl-removing enzyme [Candidatus Binatia bacterium]